MSDDVTGTEAEEQLPEGQYYASLLGRKILVKQINEAQSIVLGTIYRNLSEIHEMGEALKALGRIGRLFEALIVKAEDHEFLEDKILAGELELADFAAIFLPTTQEKAPTTGPKKPRRAR